MITSWTDSQLQELERVSKTHPKAHIRTKAKAVLAVARGKTQREVAETFDISSHTISSWISRYREEGIDGFTVRSGRGRKGQANLEEIKNLGLQSPDMHGFKEGRWQLRTLAEAIPSLNGLSPSGVWRALRRAGLKFDSRRGMLTESKRTSKKSNG